MSYIYLPFEKIMSWNVKWNTSKSTSNNEKLPSFQVWRHLRELKFCHVILTLLLSKFIFIRFLTKVDFSSFLINRKKSIEPKVTFVLNFYWHLEDMK